MTKVKSMAAFLKLSRPHFLMGGFLMFALGVSLTGSATVIHYVVAQLMVSTSQLTAHFLNEYADYEADKAIENRTSFSGGSGVLVAGTFTPIVALRAGQSTTLLCMIFAASVALYSPAAAAIGLLTLIVSWTYSMPPARLVSTGWGELATAITVAGLVPLIGALISNPDLTIRVPWTMFALIPVQLMMLLAFELPDLASDQKVGKRVLGVRLGSARTIRLMMALGVTAVVAVVLGSAANELPVQVALGFFLGAPTLGLTFAAAKRHRYSLLTLCAVASFALCGTGMFIGALVS